MRTIKEVSKLTGISVRMLHYYDEIGLFKPSSFSKAGYRLYDDESLIDLKQILFFKELDIPLKEIKKIIESPYFDKMKTLKEQKKLLTAKRDRLNVILDSLDRTLKGENNMSFKEFNMSEYYKVWEEYRQNNAEDIKKTFGSMKKFDEMIKAIKGNEEKIAENAVKVYGSVDKCAESMKNELNSYKMKNLKKQFNEFQEGFFEGKDFKLKELFFKLTSDINLDSHDPKIQKIADEITQFVKRNYEVFKGEKGDDRWYHMCRSFRNEQKTSEDVTRIYGKGAAFFIADVFAINLKDKKPELDRLYEMLASHLNEDPASKEVQHIVGKIADATKRNMEYMMGKTNMNYTGFILTLSDVYLKASSDAENAVDKRYGKGSAKFIGQAFKTYGSVF